MADATLGTASIDVALNIEKLERDLQALQGQMARALDDAGTIAKTNASASRLAKTLRTVATNAKAAASAIGKVRPPKTDGAGRVGRSTARMPLRLDLSKLGADIERARARVAKQTARMSVSLDSKAVSGMLAELKTRASTAKVAIGLRFAAASFREALTDLRVRAARTKLAVGIRFDRKSVREQLGKISGLKSAIKIPISLDTKGIKAQVAKLRRDIEGGLRGIRIGDVTGGVRKSFENVGETGSRAMRRVADEARNAGGAIGGIRAPLGAIAGIAASLGLGRLVTQAFQLSSGFEQTEIAFATMLGSAEAATAMLNDLERFASSTPFNFTDITKGAQQLTAYGFAAENVIPVLNGMGNAVAAIGGGAEEFGRLTVALGQLRNKGKASAEELKQIGELGIPVAEILTEKLGLTAEQVQNIGDEGISSGEVLTALFEGFEEKYGGLMDAQSNTAKGLFSNLVDEAEFAMRALGDILTDALNIKPILRGLIEITKAIRTAFEERTLRPIGLFGARLEAVKTVALGLALAALPKLALALRSVGQAMGVAIKRFLPFLLVSAAIVTAIKLVKANAFQLGDAWKRVSEYIRGRLESLRNVYYAFVMNSEAVGSSVTRILAALGTIFGEFGTVVTVVVRESIATLGILGQAFGNTFQGIGRILLGAGQIFVAYIADPLRAVGNFVADALGFIARQFTRLVRGIGRVLSPLGGVFRDWANAGIEALGERLGNSLEGLVSESALANRGLENIRDGASLLNEAAGQFGDYFNRVGQAAGNIQQAFGDFSAGAVVEAFGEIKAAGAEAASAVMETWRQLEAGEIEFTIPVPTVEDVEDAEDVGLPDFSNLIAQAQGAEDALDGTGSAASAAAEDVRSVSDVMNELGRAQEYVADKLRNDVIDESEAATEQMRNLERALEDVIAIDPDSGVIPMLVRELETLKASAPEAAKALRELREQLTTDTISRLSLQVDYADLDGAELRSALESLRSDLESEIRRAVNLENWLDAESLQKQLDEIDGALGDFFSETTESAQDALSDLEIRLELDEISLDDYIAQLESDTKRLREQTKAAFDAGDDALGEALYEAMQDANGDLESAIKRREDILQDAREAARDESLESYNEAMQDAANQYALTGDALERLNNELKAQQKRTLDLIAAKGIDNDLTQQTLLLTERTADAIARLEREQAAQAIADEFALFGDEVKRTSDAVDLQRDLVRDLADEYGTASNEVAQAQGELRTLEAQLSAVERAAALAEVQASFDAFGDELERLSGVIEVQRDTISALIDQYGATSPAVREAVDELRRLELQMAAVDRQQELSDANRLAALNYQLTGDEAQLLSAKLKAQQAFISDLAKTYRGELTPEIVDAQAQLNGLQAQLDALEYSSAIDDAARDFGLFGDRTTYLNSLIKIQQDEVARLGEAYQRGAAPLEQARAQLEAYRIELRDFTRESQQQQRLAAASDQYALDGDRVALLNAQMQAQQTYVRELADAYGALSPQAQGAQMELEALEESLERFNYQQERLGNQRELGLFGDQAKFYSDAIKTSEDELRRLVALEGDHASEIQQVVSEIETLERQQRSYQRSVNLQAINDQYRATGDEAARLNALIAEQERIQLENIEQGASDGAVAAQREAIRALRLELIELQQTKADAASALAFERDGDREAQLTSEVEARRQTVEALSREYEANSEAVIRAQRALEGAERQLESYQAAQAEPLTVLRNALADAVDQADAGFRASGNRLERVNALIAAQRDYLLGVRDAAGTQNEAYAEAEERLAALTRMQERLMDNGATALASTFDAAGFIEVQDAMLEQAEAARIMTNDVEGYIQALESAITAIDSQLSNTQVGSDAYQALFDRLEALKQQYRELATEPMERAEAAMKLQRAIARGLSDDYDVLGDAIDATESALADYAKRALADQKISERERDTIEKTRQALIRLRNERNRSRDYLNRMSAAFASAASVMEGSAQTIVSGLSEMASGLEALTKAAGDPEAIAAGIATVAGAVMQVAGDAPDSLSNNMVEGFFAASGIVAEMATGIPLLGKIGSAVGSIISTTLGDLSNGSRQVRKQLKAMSEESGGMLTENLVKAISVTQRVSRGGIAGFFGATKEALNTEATQIGLTLANGIIGTLESSLGAASFEEFAQAFDVGIDKVIQKQLIEGFIVSSAVQERIGRIVNLIRDGASADTIRAERDKLKDDTAQFYESLRQALPDLYDQGGQASSDPAIAGRQSQGIELSPSASLAVASPIVDGSRKLAMAAGQFLEAVQMFRDVIAGGINIPVTVNTSANQPAGSGNAWRILQNA